MKSKSGLQTSSILSKLQKANIIKLEYTIGRSAKVIGSQMNMRKKKSLPWGYAMDS